MTLDSLSMPGPYTVTIRPGFIAEGEHKGHLEYLHFSATDGSNVQKWWTVNAGSLDQDFRTLFGDWGIGILDRLRNGETVKLPRPLDLKEALTIGEAGND